MQCFAKKANDSINFVINKIFSFGGSGKKPDTNSVNNDINNGNSNNVSNNSNIISESNNTRTNTSNTTATLNKPETAKIDLNNQVKFSKEKK